MSLKAKVSRLFQRTIESCASQEDAIWCPGCRRKVPLGNFHHIADMVASKEFRGSIVRTSATSGQMVVPGRYASGEEYGTFVYCEECNETLSLAEKKVLIWHLCAHSPACDEMEAARRLERGNHLCAQIDKGL